MWTFDKTSAAFLVYLANAFDALSPKGMNKHETGSGSMRGVRAQDARPGSGPCMFSGAPNVVSGTPIMFSTEMSSFVW